MEGSILREIPVNLIVIGQEINTTRWRSSNTFSSLWDAGPENNNEGAEGVHGGNDNVLNVMLMITKCKAKNS